MGVDSAKVQSGTAHASPVRQQAGGSPAATHFLLSRQKKVSKEKATLLSATPFACATGAACGARSSRGRARTRYAQTIARPYPSVPALLGAARRGVGADSGTGSGSGEDAQSASSPPRIRIGFLFPHPSGWAEERRQKRIRARDCLSEASSSEPPLLPSTAGCLERSGRTQTIGSPFFWVLFFGDAKKSASPAGARPGVPRRQQT